MKYACLIMGTTAPARLKWLEQSLDFLDQQSWPFDEKLLVLDNIGDGFASADLIHSLRDRGWKILEKQAKSKAKCLQEALATLTSDIVFYNEDDILVRMPSFVVIEALFRSNSPNRVIGMASLNLGGSITDFRNKVFGDLEDIGEREVYSEEGLMVFRREEWQRNLWFFEFPGLFIRRELFSQCIEPDTINHQVEIALTKKWFDLGLDKSYIKVSIAKSNLPSVIDQLRQQFDNELLETTKFIRMMDENQGDAKFDLARIPPV